MLMIFALVSLCSFALWYYPKWFKHSSELDAGVVTGIVSIVVLVGTIGVTIAVNTQTQRMALKMNQENQQLQLKINQESQQLQLKLSQENQQLQLKIQEMNIEAMRFQARATLRDEVLKQRFPAYRNFLEILDDFGVLLVSIFNNINNTEISIEEESDWITMYKKIITALDLERNNGCFYYSSDTWMEIQHLITNARCLRDRFFDVIEVDGESYNRFKKDNTSESKELITNIKNLIDKALETANFIAEEFTLDEIEQDIGSLKSHEIDM